MFPFYVSMFPFTLPKSALSYCLIIHIPATCTERDYLIIYCLLFLLFTLPHPSPCPTLYLPDVTVETKETEKEASPEVTEVTEESADFTIKVEEEKTEVVSEGVL